MLFHRKINVPATNRSFAPSGREAEPRAQYQLEPVRILLVLSFFVLVVLAAFIAWWIQWNEAATAFLHLTEIVAGGLAGLFFGERSAIQSA